MAIHLHIFFFNYLTFCRPAAENHIFYFLSDIIFHFLCEQILFGEIFNFMTSQIKNSISRNFCWKTFCEIWLQKYFVDSLTFSGDLDLLRTCSDRRSGLTCRDRRSGLTCRDRRSGVTFIFDLLAMLSAPRLSYDGVRRVSGLRL